MLLLYIKKQKNKNKKTSIMQHATSLYEKWTVLIKIGPTT
jgi:hypothetical protein